MAEDIKFFLAWQVFLLPFFQAVIKSPCFLLIYLVYSTLMVNPLASIQSAGFQFFYQHSRRISSIRHTNVVLFAALKAAAYIVARISEDHDHIKAESSRLIKGMFDDFFPYPAL